ncbi:MAG: SCP2 sterol-binding domain-containing protein [bacterium]
MEEQSPARSARDWVNQALPLALEMMKPRTKGMHCVLGLHLAGEQGGRWTIKIREGEVLLEEGVTDYLDCVMTIPATDYLSLAAGTLTPYEAMSKGKIGLSGDLGLAAKFRTLFRI